MKMRFWLGLLLSCGVAGAAQADGAGDPRDFQAAAQRDVVPHFAAAAAALAQQEPVDVASLDAAMRKVLADWPDEPSGWELFVAYLRFAPHGEPARTESEILESFLDSPNRSVREFARNRLHLATLRESPFELRFTAMDGREVDLAELRGKVVLIDFWASWCQPCIAELPNVLQTYAEYHDQGFEIIGVSLDKERDRGAFAKLVAEKEVPWPQRFEGMGWNDSLARRLTVSAIPATFLFDRSGRLVETDLRGEALAAAVARHLGD